MSYQIYTLYIHIDRFLGQCIRVQDGGHQGHRLRYSILLYSIVYYYIV